MTAELNSQKNVPHSRKYSINQTKHHHLLYGREERRFVYARRRRFSSCSSGIKKSQWLYGRHLVATHRRSRFQAKNTCPLFPAPYIILYISEREGVAADCNSHKGSCCKKGCMAHHTDGHTDGHSDGHIEGAATIQRLLRSFQRA